MLELSRPSKHRPVQILWDDLEPGKLVWFRGWFPFNKAESELMETKVEIPTNDKCQGKIDRHLYDHQVCGDNDRIDSCRSFFLGSLMIEIGGTDFLIGTLNMGNCVGDPKFQVFNRLSAGRSFIEPFLCRG
ncbi:hypothetical protein H257_18729 [Aphanomyces astaci]|nr:hypothetical protein H257_18729 [Aphanomyces astaci]ETV64360.1 hypothetical protein H257_18729 [Aphanomyces astaci]RHY08243.1 hypothetical protein DYB36_005289 [Aphanomyces astaci]RHY17358.1 hypothetical protein DYB25_004398 [Aphanomyces astaci]RHY63751.1 hypothetical protein DYB34_005658 [Aphanomyces astaci]RHY64505.1 hypothetical protein DYB38_005577 [Aphanomyces astaci]|eukprot:XP_009846157.1 hypothetical protein H257_18729 [Aphanomyces astaci]